ncbi:MAG: hypothetical protein JF614_26980 [Acidobacteria bacterium]|nr:hypothetical protein [Acidobacteriota bacterium]
MDQELIAYLDEGSRESSQQIDGAEREGRDPLDILRERYGKKVLERAERGEPSALDILRERFGKTARKSD